MNEAQPTDDTHKLGTLLGVFTPSMLTILGVIMYLRFGWVIGNAGLGNTLLIVLLANSITFATALSVSAVATNMRVEVGGAYHIISRSLGVEVGGAIGIPLYLSQALSVTLYAFGLAEAMRFVWPAAPPIPIAAATIVGVSLISIKGAELTLKLQVPLLVLVVLSIASLVAGVRFEHTPEVQGTFATAPGGFWVVFAVFFPAVTGIMAGVSMSGDLKNPQVSLPRGTLAAVLCGFGIYLLIPVVLAVSASPSSLRDDPLVWTRLALVPFLVMPGLLCAILSSAAGSILGAPRTLQAMARDRLLPRVLGHAPHPGGEPIIAIALTATIALAAVLLGDLDAVAAVVTMFFLTTYGVVNLVAALESLVGDPSYRPTMRIHWSISLGGAIACFAVMFLINAIACVAAILIELGIYFVLRRRAISATWGDVRHGLLLTIIRRCVVALKRLPPQARNWRPHILVYAGHAQRRIGLIRLASWLTVDRGIVTVCNLVEGDLTELTDISGKRQEIDDVLRAEGITAFAEVGVVRSFVDGVVDMAQGNGIAGLSSNTVMIGWSRDRQVQVNTLQMLRKLTNLGKSMLVCTIDRDPQLPKRPSILVWWGGLRRNGDMMLLLAHQLSQNPEWLDGTITIKSVASSGESHEGIQSDLDQMIPQTRIAAERKVIMKGEDQHVFDLIQAESRGADIVFMGLTLPESGDEDAYAARLDSLIDGMPRVVLVKNSSRFSGELI